MYVMNSFGRPDSLSICVYSQSTWSPSGEAGLILPIPLPLLPAKALRSSAILAVPRCHHGSFCLSKGMLAEDMVAESGSKLLSSFLGGNGGTRRSMEQSHLPTAAFRVGNRNPPGSTLDT